ncbi:unnamed protein product [Phaedon cochleariae]|uniref:Uncharacterized protein n=1 Tax=Phaedon cochleariae TaxID=80249 RepID=A0A9P0DIZ3_PHACE|nr:unnamed protein product [Phaedon cochleariae]
MEATSILNNGGKNDIESNRSYQDNSIDLVTIEEIMENYEENKIAIQKYIKFKCDECEVDPSPVGAFLNEKIIPTLRDGLCKMLREVKQDDSFYKPRSTLNGLDFLSEYLYNMNPLHPERKSNWTYIFDVQWVVDFLENSPRPFYPLSLIWSKDVAAKKIQSFWKGYCDRKKEEVREIREFWKNIDGKEGVHYPPIEVTYEVDDTNNQ